MDSSEVGRFGTIRLMKRLEPDKVVASYPIDEEEITLGRDPERNIRLYYETVSGLHCKIIFRERKAFLVVLGVNGVVIDGCPVYPVTGPSAQPVTVPLPNNSTIEIHKKRFQFCYPPKELRATLISTPTRPQDSTPDRRRRRKTLRMSMIHSAQVFTPRPSQDPRENLRILKTPIKSPFMRQDYGYNRRMSSPLKRGAYIPEEDEEDEEDEDRDIVLVESNHPRVVEEDRDLVILEHVVAPEPEPEPPQQVVYPIPQAALPPAHLQHTPARRRPRASLHRAVLIRSAHRTALQKEMEVEEEREAEEVEEIFEQVEQMQDLRDDEDDVEEDEHMGRDEQPPQTPTVTSGWRKSLGLVTGWAFGGSPAHQTTQEGNEEDEQPGEIEITEEEDQEEPPTLGPDEEITDIEEDPDAMDTEGGEVEPASFVPPASHETFPVSGRPLGKFMTPQVSRQADFGGLKNRPRSHVRYSVGGFTPGGIYGAAATSHPGPSNIGGASGPRRVRVVEPWKIDEITVPLNEVREGAIEDEGSEEIAATVSTPQRGIPMSPSKRERLTEEEKKAIIRRRKSALTEPDFFGGQTPGRRLSLFPPPSPMKSPIKQPPIMDELSHVPDISVSQDTTTKPEGDEDTSILLARMKHMVEDVKRRQSMGPRPSLAGLPTPRKSSGFSLLAPEADSAPVKKIFAGTGDEKTAEEDDVSDKENGDVLNELEEDVQMDESETLLAAASGSRSAALLQTPRPAGPTFRASREHTANPRSQVLPKMSAKLAHPSLLETPHLEGVRPLFVRADRANPEDALKHPHTLATPGFEGIGEMLGTPAGYQMGKLHEAKEPEHNEIAGPEEPPAEATRSSRTRKPASRGETNTTHTPLPQAIGPSATPELPTEEPTASTARVTRKTRSKIAESDTENQDAEPQPRTARRTRKTTPSPAPEEPGTATRSLRKTRTKTPTPTPEDPPATRSSSSRRRARTPIAEVDEEDPIDSLGDERAVSPEVPAPEESAPPKGDSRVRRSARGKLTLQVKEEEEEIPAAPSKGPAETSKTQRSGVPRAVRGRRPVASTAAATLPRTSSIPRGTARGAKASSLKRPATTGSTKLTAESAATPVVGDKENTPEADEDEPAPPTATGKATAGRSASRLATKTSTRTAGRTRAASVDQSEKPVDTGRSRVSRTKAAAKK